MNPFHSFYVGGPPKKQMLRLGGAVACLLSGLYLLISYERDKGVHVTQCIISALCPEEYEVIDRKVQDAIAKD